jgi:hypothetical protein
MAIRLSPTGSSKDLHFFSYETLRFHLGRVILIL